MNDTLDTRAVFDADAVSSLTGDPGDRQFAVVFVTRYRALLPERVRRIAVALATDEVDDAMDAVLSLKVASMTVGAREVAGVAARIEQLLRSGDVARAGAVEVAGPVERVDRALGAFLQA